MERKNVIKALESIAQDTRLDIFRLLVKAGGSGLSAGKIAEALKVPNNTLSFHLVHLKNANLVDSERQGTSIIYRANYQAMNELIGYLTENCCVDSPGDCCSPA